MDVGGVKMVLLRRTPQYKKCFAEYVSANGGNPKEERMNLRLVLWRARLMIVALSCFLLHVWTRGIDANRKWCVLVVVVGSAVIIVCSLCLNRKALCWKADEYASYKAKHEKEG